MITKGGAPSQKQNNKNGDARQGNHYIITLRNHKVSFQLNIFYFRWFYFWGLIYAFVCLFAFWLIFFPCIFFGGNGSVLICALRRPLSLLTASPLPYKNLSFVFIMRLYLACLHLPPVGMCLLGNFRTRSASLPPRTVRWKKTTSHIYCM